MSSFRRFQDSRNEAEVAILLIIAAERGSHYAPFILGMAYYEGTPVSSIRTDLDRAKYWLEKSVSVIRTGGAIDLSNTCQSVMRKQRARHSRRSRRSGRVELDALFSDECMQVRSIQHRCV